MWMLGKDSSLSLYMLLSNSIYGITGNSVLYLDGEGGLSTEAQYFGGEPSSVSWDHGPFFPTLSSFTGLGKYVGKLIERRMIYARLIVSSSLEDSRKSLTTQT
jgi:hypothetical protein